MADELPVSAPAGNAEPQTQSNDWRASLPEDMRNSPSLAKFSEIPALAGAYVNLERMLGTEKVPRPKGDFDPQNPDWGMFLDAAGRPKSADEYKFGEAKLPDGMEYDKGLEDKFKPIFHMAGLNQKQADMLREAFIAYQGEGFTKYQTEYKTSIETATAELQKELGSAYEPTVNAAKVALKEYADEKFVKWLDDSGMGNHPEIVRIFGKIGKETLGDTKLRTTDPGAFNAPGDWQKQAMAFQAENAHILYTHGHPLQAQKHAEWTRLMQLAYPDGQQ